MAKKKYKNETITDDTVIVLDVESDANTTGKKKLHIELVTINGSSYYAVYDCCPIDTTPALYPA